MDSSIRQLAVKLADSLVRRSYHPTMWDIYVKRFTEVLQENGRNYTWNPR